MQRCGKVQSFKRGFINQTGKVVSTIVVRCRDCYGVIVVGSAGGGMLVDPVERVDAPPLPPPPPQADRIAALIAVKMMVLILVLIADILFPFLVI